MSKYRRTHNSQNYQFEVLRSQIHSKPSLFFLRKGTHARIQSHRVIFGAGVVMPLAVVALACAALLLIDEMSNSEITVELKLTT